MNGLSTQTNRLSAELPSHCLAFKAWICAGNLVRPVLRGRLDAADVGYTTLIAQSPTTLIGWNNLSMLTGQGMYTHQI